MIERKKAEASAIVAILVILLFAGPALIWGVNGFLVVTCGFVFGVLGGCIFLVVYIAMWEPGVFVSRPILPPPPPPYDDDEGGQ